MSGKPISNIGLGSDSSRGFSNANDPFNYPMPSRGDLMSLQTIGAKKDNLKTTTKTFTTVRNNSSNLHTSDIDGAVPKLHGSKQVNKPDFMNQNWDIERAGPRALHMNLYKVETNLNTQDIGGAQPQVNKFKSTRMGNDPLNPTYKLSNVEQRPATPPRFIRDQMTVDDIDRAKPKENAQNKLQTRATMRTDDIPGTKSIPRHQARKAEFSSLDYSDVTKKARVSQRCSNPLDPTYTIADEDGKPCEIGKVDGARPAAMPDKPREQAINRHGSLSTKDIAGAQTSSKGLGVFANAKRRPEQMTSTSLNTKDIDGSGAGSLAKGIKSKRVGNPLTGNYNYPGAAELADGNDPFSLTRAEKLSNARKDEAVQRETLKNAGAKTLTSTKRSETGQAPWGLDKVPEFKEKAFKESYGNFYEMGDRDVSKLDYNKLYAASRGPGGKNESSPGSGSVDPKLQNDLDFKQNKKVFFEGRQSDTESVYNANAAKFFGANDKTKLDVGGKFGAIQSQINPNGEAYRKNQAAFVGEDYVPMKVNQSPPKEAINTNTGGFKHDAKKFYGHEKAETESQGSQFQRNAAVFMGTDAPAPGTRPVKIDKNAPGEDFSKVKGGSVLNAERLKQHEQQMARDPVFKKNMKRFYGEPSAATKSSAPKSIAQKFDFFIGKENQ